jgi:aryl-alcohol dehydrogenase-like predicted oxidoreductase
VSIGTSKGSKINFNYEEFEKILEQAVNNGVNYIDTADTYDNGEAENFLGRFLGKIDRDKVLIGTKVFGPNGQSWMKQGLSLRHINNSCVASLKRLSIDVIDLYQCHRFDPYTPLEETCYAMNKLIQDGLIRYWGISQWSALQLFDAIRICERNNWKKPVSAQMKYNLFDRSIEVDFIELCEKEGIGILVYSPLAQGILTGKYLHGKIPLNSRMNNLEELNFFPSNLIAEKDAHIEELNNYAKNLGYSLTSLALSWTLRPKTIKSVITCASTVDQITDNINSTALLLNSDVLDGIEKLLKNDPINQYTGKKIGYRYNSPSNWLLPIKKDKL